MRDGEERDREEKCERETERASTEHASPKDGGGAPGSAEPDAADAPGAGAAHPDEAEPEKAYSDEAEPGETGPNEAEPDEAVGSTIPDPDRKSLEAFWVRARNLCHIAPLEAVLGQDDVSSLCPPAFSFGDTPELADRLAKLVLDGEKTATSGWRASYGRRHRRRILRRAPFTRGRTEGPPERRKTRTPRSPRGRLRNTRGCSGCAGRGRRRRGSRGPGRRGCERREADEERGSRDPGANRRGVTESLESGGPGEASGRGPDAGPVKPNCRGAQSVGDGRHQSAIGVWPRRGRLTRLRPAGPRGNRRRRQLAPAFETLTQPGADFSFPSGLSFLTWSAVRTSWYPSPTTMEMISSDIEESYWITDFGKYCAMV